MNYLKLTLQHTKKEDVFTPKHPDYKTPHKFPHLNKESGFIFSYYLCFFNIGGSHYTLIVD